MHNTAKHKNLDKKTDKNKHVEHKKNQLENKQQKSLK